MKRKTNKGEYSVSLFPFLTVLICTMGALIVMLVMAVRAASQDSQKLAEKRGAELEQLLVEATERRELHQVQFEGWQAKRDELVEANSRSRETVEYLEGEIKQLQRRQQELGAQFAALQPGPANSESQLSEEIKQLRAQIVGLTHELNEKQHMVSQQPVATMYSIVPYFGPNSTTRRPIYIECVNDKLILQPSGIELSEGDFPFDLRNGNPLESALSTIRQHWTETNVTGAEESPYPLLVVRPSGGRAYALARRAMVNWVDEFGYELIDASLTLDFGSTDSVLNEKIEAAVRQAKLESVSRNLKLKQAERDVLGQRSTLAKNGVTGGGSGELEVDIVNGGFKRKNGGTAGGQYVKQSPASGDPQSVATKPKADDANANSFEPNASRQKRGADKTTDASSPGANNQSESGTGGNASAGGGSPDATCLADQRGMNWALPDTPGRTVALVRSVRVFCSDRQLVLIPDVGTNDERVTIELGSAPTLDSVPTLVSEIQKKIESWGPAVQSGYWRPQLELRVIPGGEQRYQDLAVLLKDSGLELKAHK
jgi:hypothetical protein